MELPQEMSEDEDEIEEEMPDSIASSPPPPPNCRYTSLFLLPPLIMALPFNEDYTSSVSPKISILARLADGAPVSIIGYRVLLVPPESEKKVVPAYERTRLQQRSFTNDVLSFGSQAMAQPR